MTNVGEDVDHQELAYTAPGSVNCYNYLETKFEPDSRGCTMGLDSVFPHFTLNAFCNARLLL